LRRRSRLRESSVQITIAAEPLDSADARRLIAALDAHLAERYPPEEVIGLTLRPEHVEPGRGTFVIARGDGVAIGCGALHKLDETTSELKRMFVDPAVRGRGVGKEILDHLERAGQSWGARRLVLGTGSYQTEAIGLYRRAGFKEIECVGEYATSPSSLCFEKEI